MMTKKHSAKAWVTPIIAIVFTVVALTGVMKAFDAELPGTEEVHSLLGLLLVLVGLAHVMLNWKVLVFYLKQHRAALYALIFGLILVTALVFLGIHGSKDEGIGEGADNGNGYSLENGD
jgi:membrane protease YdiL (CAAX protease family)